MPLVTMKEMVQAGLHFGHAAASWNPKMGSYLHGIRKRVHIFDLKQTAKGLVAACHFTNQLASQGRKFLFVGTKPQAQEAVREVAEGTQSHYVNERWLGGMLTNHAVAMRRMARFNELEEIVTAESSDYSKKVLSSFNRELKKLRRDLNGVRNMLQLPDAVIIIDPRHEHIAVREANICGVPIIALTDTNCNPDNIEIVIPGNDDAIRAIRLVLGKIRESILDGQQAYSATQASAAEESLGVSSAEVEQPDEASVSTVEV